MSSKEHLIAELHAISGTENPDRAGDVVFVHGLGGHWKKTWNNGNPEGFWPAWLGADYPEFGVWSVEYEAARSGWFGHAMPLQDRATNLVDLLLGHGIGERPICFVCHSMGGLVVKQMLRHASDAHDDRLDLKQLLSRARGVLFLATPHTGSDMASLTKYLDVLMRRTDAVKDLERNAAPLRDINRRYRNSAPRLGIDTKVFGEDRPVSGGLFVVDEASADPGLPGVEVIKLEADHNDVCRPADKGAHM